MIDYQWDNLFGMVGFKDIAKKYFKDVPHVSNEVRQDYLRQVDHFISLLFETKLGEIGPNGNAELLTKLVAQGYLNGRI